VRNIVKSIRAYVRAELAKWAEIRNWGQRRREELTS